MPLAWIRGRPLGMEYCKPGAVGTAQGMVRCSQNQAFQLRPIGLAVCKVSPHLYKGELRPQGKAYEFKTRRDLHCDPVPTNHTNSIKCPGPTKCATTFQEISIILAVLLAFAGLLRIT